MTEVQKLNKVIYFMSLVTKSGFSFVTLTASIASPTPIPVATPRNCLSSFLPSSGTSTFGVDVSSQRTLHWEEKLFLLLMEGRTEGSIFNGGRKACERKWRDIASPQVH